MATSTRLPSTERRAAILEAAIALFAERGFRGVTTRELAQRVGVSEPILYQHFPSKKELYDAIIESAMDSGYYEALEGLRKVANSENDEEFFRHLAESMVRWHTTRPEMIRLKLFSALEGHGLIDEFNEKTSQPFIEVIVGYIERRMAEGVYTRLDARATAFAFVGMIAHHCTACLLFQSPVVTIDSKLFIDHAVMIFLNGIRERNA
ncbi:MAG: TetR/AcrR family transcriptional regulator [Bryobacter sp.]